MYYLETNAIRKLAGKLYNLVDANCFTSILTLIELLSGINSQREYELRRSIMTKVYDSKIYIDWDTWIEKFLNSYGIPLKLDRVNDYIQIIETLIDSKSYSVFLNSVNSKNKEVWDFINKVDDELSVTLKSSFSGRFQNFKLTSDVKASRDQSRNRWSNFSISDIDYYVAHPMIRFAERVSKESSLNPENKTAEELIKQYDKTLDVAFVIAFLYSESKIFWGSDPGINDNADLAHTFYLNDLETILVTDDKLLKKLFVKIMPTRQISCKEFLKNHYKTQ